MTIGIGGSNAQIELEKLTNMTRDVEDISTQEYQQRVHKAQQLMKQQNIAATYINAGTNLYYFTGTRWYASERMVGAIIPQQGEIIYIAPYFEVDTLKLYMAIPGKVAAWQEHENPYQLFLDTLASLDINVQSSSQASPINIALDESTQFFIADGIKKLTSTINLVNAKPITAGCRMQKSDHEIAIMQRAMDMTLAVHKAVGKILHVGITTQEVTNFIDLAHRKVGAPKGSYFCIVLFGKDSSYPHGVKNTKVLESNDVVLIDTGCQVFGYNSDITRTYVFGEPTQRQRDMWDIEKQAQLVGFNAAKLGEPCGDVDVAARNYIATQGLGPDYQTPGCPHRTGHGIGLDIHEWPYLVRSDRTPLAKGMAFSNEPMLVIPNEFGIRLEDHFYMTDTGAKWFTEPSHTLDDPFGYEK